MKIRRILSYSMVTLVVAESLLVLVSWVLSATLTGSVRSLLSSEGIRWFLGSFVSMLSRPGLVWLLLLSMACGSLWRSGLLTVCMADYRQRLAFRVVMVVVVLYLALILTLTAIPHAILLSATGCLFPSAFSRALVPILSFGVVVASLTFGLMSGRFQHLSDALYSLSYGIAESAPLFVLYVLFVQFLNSLAFVFF